MKVACPACGQTVDVSDGTAGTAAKCPKCLAEIRRPGADASAGAARPGEASPAQAIGGGEPKPPAKPPSKRACYLVRCSSPQTSDVPEARSKLLELLVKTADALKIEQLGYEYVQVDEDKVPELRPDDMVVLVEVTKYKPGSQFIRYMLTFLAWFGVGDCRMDVNVVIRRGDGSKETFPLTARQVMGMAGGNASGMMDMNVKVISNALVRKIAQRKLLNATVYQNAAMTTVLGVLGIIPFLGVVLSLAGLILGITTMAALAKRRLTKRATLAKVGTILCGITLVAGAAVTYYLIEIG